MAEYLAVRRSLSGDRAAGRLAPRLHRARPQAARVRRAAARQRLGQAAGAADQGRQAQPARIDGRAARPRSDVLGEVATERGRRRADAVLGAQQRRRRRRGAGRCYAWIAHRQADADDRDLHDRARHGIDAQLPRQRAGAARRCSSSCTAFRRRRSSGTSCSSTSATAIAASRRTCAATSGRRRRPTSRRTAPSTWSADIAALIDVARRRSSRRWSRTTGAARSPGASRRSGPRRSSASSSSTRRIPATFLRELQHNPAQQAASAYMNFLCRPDAEALLAPDDFARLWPFFTNMGAADPARDGGGWLTDEVRERYRAVWRAGLRGGCNYYRASPLRPPTRRRRPDHEARASRPSVTSHVPTLVIWAEDDSALPVVAARRPRGVRARPARRARARRDALDRPRAAGARRRRDRARARALSGRRRQRAQREVAHQPVDRALHQRLRSRSAGPARAEPSRSSARRVIEWVRAGDSPANRKNRLAVAAPEQLHAAPAALQEDALAVADAQRLDPRRRVVVAAPPPPLGRCSAGTVSIDERSITESLKLRAGGVSGTTSSRMRWTISSGVSAPLRRRARARAAAPRCGSSSARRARPAARRCGSATSSMPTRSRCSRPGSSASRRCRLCGWSGIFRLQSRSSTVFSVAQRLLRTARRGAACRRRSRAPRCR